MKEEKRNFIPISEEYRRILEECIYQNIIQNFRCEEIEKDSNKYRVVLQGVVFITTMTDEELKESISLVIDIMEELKRINNNGLTKKVLQEREVSEKNEDSVLGMIEIWQIIKTQRLLELIEKLDVVHRVGGAYAMLISNPCFESAINAVFEMIVDKFDDGDLYDSSTHFLARAAMRMCSDEESEHEDAE